MGPPNAGLGPVDVEASEGTREVLTPDTAGTIEAFWVENLPFYDTSETPYQHDGEEFGIVLSGTRDVYLDGIRHRLEAGDSIRYSSTIPHWYVNPRDVKCVAGWVATHPIW